MPTKKLASF